MKSRIVFILLTSFLSECLGLSGTSVESNHPITAQTGDENGNPKVFYLRGVSALKREAGNESLGTEIDSARYLKENEENSEGMNMDNMNMENFNAGLNEYMEDPLALFSKPIDEWETIDWVTALMMLSFLSCILCCFRKIACCGVSLLDCLMCYCCCKLCCNPQASTDDYVGM
jgi:hypothetical protein